MRRGIGEWMRAAAVGLFLAALGCGRSDSFDADWRPARYFEAADRSSEIDTIVLHTTEGSYDPKRSFALNQEENYERSIRYFVNPGSRMVSAHYVLGPRGQATRMVREKDVAWHATYYNRRSIGIECAGWADRAETWTPRLLDRLSELVSYLSKKYGLRPEHPRDTALSSGGFLRVGGIVGHDQVQTPGSKAVKGGGERTDPGPHFPWGVFLFRVNARR